MRALRLLSLAAALVVPAAAAHAQFGVYVGPPVRYAAPVYGPAFYGPGIHYDHLYYGRPHFYGYHRDWRGYRGWAHDGRYGYGARW